MARQKISEYRSKKIAADLLGIDYTGWGFNYSEIDGKLDEIDGYHRYVIKVDQAVKGRYKKGLVLLDVEQSNVRAGIEELHTLGYDSFIIEPLVAHNPKDERYLALSYTKDGSRLSYSSSGGVDIEANASTIQSIPIGISTDWGTIGDEIGLTSQQLRDLVNVFNEEYMTMLEINPYIVKNNNVKLLDIAIEVDDAATYFSHLWSEADFRFASAKKMTDEERTVRDIDENSPASLKLEVINPNGSIFLLLSGGGASVVVADELCNLGFGKQLGNYGEYSGNPNEHETYLYTKAVLNLLLKSDAPKKVLFIGGAVANFTDIANTFTGIIMAINEVAAQLRDQKVKVFVRRGGPRQEIGLAKIKSTLETKGLLGAVHDPSVPITSVVAEAVKGMSQ